MKNNKKTDFKPFKIGTIFNPFPGTLGTINHQISRVSIKYPSRIEAMAIDPSKIAMNDNLKYTPGQIDFAVSIYKHVKVRKNKSHSTITISKSSPRQTLIKHSAEIIRQALNIEDGLDIDVQEQVSLRHCGLGSSSGLIASVACAINELYGKPIKDKNLVRYLAQNHGEEIDGSSELITPVQCIGGSVAAGSYQGGLIIIAGENKVIKTMNISSEYKVVIGIPKDFKYPDSKYLLKKEVENLYKFLETGKKYGPVIAYRLFHEVLPDLTDNKINKLGDLIFDYRFRMGSIKNCDFVYPPLVKLAKKLEVLKNQNTTPILSLSSVGPGFFVITKDAKSCEDFFKQCGMLTIKTTIHNGRYKILDRK